MRRARKEVESRMNIISRIKGVTAEKYRKFALPIFAPVFLFAMVLFVGGLTAYKNSISGTNKFYTEMMENMAVGCEDRLKGIIGGLQFLVKEKSVIEFMNMSDVDTSNIGELGDAFENFAQSYNGIGTMFILNPNKKYVINESGVKSLGEYFGDRYYKSYPLSYWQNIFFWDNSIYRILSPSVYYDENGEKNVIPIVFRKAGDAKSQNFLIVNIDFDVFFERQIKPDTAGDAQVCVLNRYTGQVFGDRRNMAENIIDTELYNMLVSGKNGFYCDVAGTGRSFITAYSTSNTILGYTYFSVIPVSHIRRARYSTIMIIFAAVLVFAMACLILLKGLREVFKPINIIIGSSDEREDNLDVAGKIETILKQNAELKKLLPFAEEQYLIRYLNSIDFYNDSTLEEIMAHHVNFRYPYFSVVLVQMYPAGDFFEKYSAAEYDNIRNGFIM